MALVQILENKSVANACFFILIALVFDFFDGFLARLFKVSLVKNWIPWPM
jgi:phosphatidylserine synthase